MCVRTFRVCVAVRVRHGVDDLLNTGCEDEKYANKSFDDAAINKHDIICQARRLHRQHNTFIESSNHAQPNYEMK
jgi:hypothetical protein